MDLERLQTLYRYNRWANARILTAAASLSADDLLRDLGGSHRSVRDTLVHLMGAEWIWLRRWKGTSPKALLPAADFPMLEHIRARWDEVERELAEFTAALTKESLGRSIGYVNSRGETWTYTLWQMMQHVVNHSTYHRGQVATMLRQLGAEAPATDLLVFYDEGWR